MTNKMERNYVADAYNWEQRVKVENESARIWTSNWGELYAKDEPPLYDSKIKQIEQKMNEMSVDRIMSNSQMSFKFVQPYREWGPDFKRKTFGKFDEFAEVEEDGTEAEVLHNEPKKGERRKRGYII